MKRLMFHSILALVIHVWCLQTVSHPKISLGSWLSGRLQLNFALTASHATLGNKR
jgi:hypothetical protein